ncbi:hypothetical protein T484DRAFT_1877686, partial [Baffinella frigidus]
MASRQVGEDLCDLEDGAEEEAALLFEMAAAHGTDTRRRALQEEAVLLFEMAAADPEEAALLFEMAAAHGTDTRRRALQGLRIMHESGACAHAMARYVEAFSPFQPLPSLAGLRMMHESGACGPAMARYVEAYGCIGKLVQHRTGPLSERTGPPRDGNGPPRGERTGPPRDGGEGGAWAGQGVAVLKVVCGMVCALSKHSEHALGDLEAAGGFSLLSQIVLLGPPQDGNGAIQEQKMGPPRVGSEEGWEGGGGEGEGSAFEEAAELLVRMVLLGSAGNPVSGSVRSPEARLRREPTSPPEPSPLSPRGGTPSILHTPSGTTFSGTLSGTTFSGTHGPASEGPAAGGVRISQLSSGGVSLVALDALIGCLEAADRADVRSVVLAHLASLFTWRSDSYPRIQTAYSLVSRKAAGKLRGLAYLIGQLDVLDRSVTLAAMALLQ